MSDNKKLKKAVRARCERTGETYSTARMHVLQSTEAGKVAAEPVAVVTPTAVPRPPTVRELTRKLALWTSLGPPGVGVLSFFVYQGNWYLELSELCRDLQHGQRGLRRMLREEWSFLTKEPALLARWDESGVRILRPPVVVATRQEEHFVLLTRHGVRRLLEEVDHPNATPIREHIPGAVRRIYSNIRREGPILED